MTACRSCGAAVLWVVMRDTGRRMPLDAQPAPAGNVVLDDLDRARVMRADEERLTGKTYTSHFATCSQAGQWRKRRS